MDGQAEKRTIKHKQWNERPNRITANQAGAMKWAIGQKNERSNTSNEMNARSI